MKKNYFFVILSTLILSVFTHASTLPNLTIVQNKENPPVTYLNYNALIYENGVILNWVTEFEKNSDYFEIERSFDGNEFITIGLVLDALSSFEETKSYKFKDNSDIIKTKAKAYYRLKLINKDGTINYSNTLEIKIKEIKNAELAVSPNPFTETITIDLKSIKYKEVGIKFINTIGQTVYAIKMPLIEGKNSFTISQLESLLPGNYIMNVVIENNILASQKVIKQ